MAARQLQPVGYLLLLDVLGTKHQWQVAGQRGALKLFGALRQLIGSFMNGSPALASQVTAGAIETDCAILAFDEATHAVQAGVDIFQRAFLRATRRRHTRLWLRGVVVTAERGGIARRSSPLRAGGGRIEGISYSPDLLNAIQLERAGFKGMRLLVAPPVVSRLQPHLAIPVNGGTFFQVRRLRHSRYPSKRLDGCQDALWMVRDSAGWDEICRLMDDRLRWSALQEEEFVQAAATSVVFTECAAILGRNAAGGRAYVPSRRAAGRSPPASGARP